MLGMVWLPYAARGLLGVGENSAMSERFSNPQTSADYSDVRPTVLERLSIETMESPAFSPAAFSPMYG